MELTHEQKINFVGALLLHRKRRDDAIGLRHVTTAQKGWIWYYNKLIAQKEGAELYQPVIKKLIDEAESATPERQAEILATVEQIKKRIHLGLVGGYSAGPPPLIETYKGWQGVTQQGDQDG